MVEMYEEDGKKLWRVMVFIKDKDRRQHSRKRKGVSSERKARDIEFEFKTELERLMQAQCTHTWASWYKECIRRMSLTFRRSTIANYESRMRNWVPKTWDAKFLTEFTPEDIHHVIYQHIGDQLTSVGQEKVWKMIRRIFEMGVEEGILIRNPAKAIKVRGISQEQQVLTATEAQTLLEQSRASDHRFWAIWTFALMSGMRSGEMYAIRWTDIDLSAGTLSITKQWTNKDGICPPKWGSSRVVPISDEFKEFLIEWRRLNPGFKKELFDQRIKQLTNHEDYILPELAEWHHGMQADALRDFCKVLGITPVRFHDLRATFITNLLVQGAELPKVMMIVGHRKMGTTDKYLRKAGVPVQGVTNALGYKPATAIPLENVVAFPKKSSG